jgi:hypothetical protein
MGPLNNTLRNGGSDIQTSQVHPLIQQLQRHLRRERSDDERFEIDRMIAIGASIDVGVAGGQFTTDGAPHMSARSFVNGQ